MSQLLRLGIDASEGLGDLAGRTRLFETMEELEAYADSPDRDESKLLGLIVGRTERKTDVEFWSVEA